MAALAAVSLGGAAAALADSVPHLTVRPVVARNQVIPASTFAALLPGACFLNGRQVQCKEYPKPHANLRLVARATLPRPGGKNEEVLFLTFPSQGQGRCLGTLIVHEKGRGFTPDDAPTCDHTDTSRCASQVCGVDYVQGPHSGVSVLLVPASAHTLHITDIFGQSEQSFGLTGPVIRGMANLRPFVIELSGIAHVGSTPWYFATVD